MSSREANIERLNGAIMTLGEDAESMHSLIARSTEGLESATEAGNRAADNAAKLIEALEPLTEQLNTQIQDSQTMLTTIQRASDEQNAAVTKQLEKLDKTSASAAKSLKTSAQSAHTKLETMVERMLIDIGADSRSAQTELRKLVEDTFDDHKKAQDEAFEELKATSLKEYERTRDELQTDILGFKNATSSRLDNLEAEIAKAKTAITELETKVVSSIDAANKKLLIPLYIAIGVGVADLICLLMLLMR